jgi:hypothetical protein
VVNQEVQESLDETMSGFPLVFEDMFLPDRPQ